MIYELKLRGLVVTSQKDVPIIYKGVKMDSPLRYDLLVEDCIVVELKAVLELQPIFDAKAMTYANLLKVPKAIIINFTCTNIWKEGQRTFVNDYFSALPEK